VVVEKENLQNLFKLFLTLFIVPVALAALVYWLHLIGSKAPGILVMMPVYSLIFKRVIQSSYASKLLALAIAGYFAMMGFEIFGWLQYGKSEWIFALLMVPCTPLAAWFSPKYHIGN
jgi:hypothetical protein